MEPLPYMFVAVVLLVLIPFWVWHWRRSRELVEKWAAENCFAIEEMERRFLRVGPFFWRSRGHEVFYVVVHDTRGERRTAYVRTGGWWAGQFSDQVKVSWTGNSRV